MTRRALIFTVPKGKEIHYSKIQGPIIGSVWAPLYHSYSYYVPANTSRDPDGDDAILKRNSKLALGSALLTLLSCAAFGVKPLIRAAVGGVLWAESESAFATWDGHVTFGSSHVSAHAGGFFVWSAIREILKGKYSTSRLLLLAVLSLLSLPEILVDVDTWAGDGFRPVGYFHIHRVDHVAHIGGILTGFLNAYLQLG